MIFRAAKPSSRSIDAVRRSARTRCAQVLEQTVTGITIFADVDMSPEELTGDFAHGDG